MAGIRNGGQRAKTSKNLRASAQKKFRNDSDDARKAYTMKLAKRMERRTKKRGKK